VVGPSRARDLLLLSRKLSGTEAAEWGIAHRAVAVDRVEFEASELAGELANGPTVSLGLTKWLLYAGANASLDDQLRNEGFAMELSSRSEDFKEGLAAFSDRRSPRFTGR
jgi:2-(1,2-epoxy-1,2-dihydrophenyl)acetyl-CoA isomerase